MRASTLVLGAGDQPLQRVDQLGNCDEEVLYEAVVGDLEDRARPGPC